MTREEIELILDNVLLACQFCLASWQIMKFTAVGALIHGVIGWWMQPFGLSPTYSRLQHCRGRVFKRVNCFALEGDIPFQRRDIPFQRRAFQRRDIPFERRDMEEREFNAMKLTYLGRHFLLERKGEGNMLFIDQKMCYYITHTIWKELQTLAEALLYDLPGPAGAAGGAVRADAACDCADMDSATAAAAARVSLATSIPSTVFVKGYRDCFEKGMTGGVMTLWEVLDAVILYNQHVSERLNNVWLLPINMSVSEETLPKCLNLVALFLQNQRLKVDWLIPLPLSLISALLEFSTTLRAWLYSKVNVLFCYIMHSLCDPLPRSWRRQLYSLGMWVEDLTPSNDLLLKVVRGNMCAIITEGAKVDKEGAILVRWLETESDFTPDYGVIERGFRCDPIEGVIRCIYVIEHDLCEISASSISMFYVKCENVYSFRRIITLVSCIAENYCGSLISYGPNNKVRVRGFKESVTSYVKSGLPPVYKLELAW